MQFFEDLQFQIILRHLYAGRGSWVYHPESPSLEFVRSGEMLLKHDGNIRSLHSPAIFWMKRGEEYQFIRKDHTSLPCEHLYCNFSGPRAERIIQTVEDSCPDGFVIPHDPEQVSRIFFDMLKYYRVDKEYYHPELVLCCEKLMLEIARTLRPAAMIEHDHYKIWQTAEDIRKDPFCQFNFSVLARNVGITEDHFRRLFRQTHKMPLMAYVRTQKMIRASELLTLSSMRIKEIAAACHFSSLMDFSRSFKRYAGMSPEKYRELKRQSQ